MLGKRFILYPHYFFTRFELRADARREERFRDLTDERFGFLLGFGVGFGGVVNSDRSDTMPFVSSITFPLPPVAKTSNT